MMVTEDKTSLLLTLERLVERLSAPDLTATEANEIRPRLHGVLAALNEGGQKAHVDPAYRRELRPAVPA